MPKILSKKTKRFRIIKDSVDMGFSGNKIQKILQDTGYGMRRKKLYDEIRAIKKTPISKEKRERSIPKKYRKKRDGIGIGKVDSIYRGSLIISSVPLHSTPFNRNYLGFRLNIFSFDKREVYSAMRRLRRMFIEMVGDYLRSFMYAQEQTLGVENPTKIFISNPEKYNDRWFFAVEEKGRDKYSKDGRI